MTDVNVSVSNVAAPSADGQAPSCPVCASPQTQLLCEVDGYRVWRCPESATDFVSPMPDDRTLAELYDREEWFEGGERGGYANYDEQTQHSVQLVDDVLDEFGTDGEGRSILDVGCGYGKHLARAAEHGWKCFGVEPSAHARKVCGERHGDKMYIVAQVEDLIPHEFGVILLLDTIEHLKDPYALFYELFSKGTITPATRVVITTPNARSNAAVAVPADWAYRHPPSHLVYYSAESLRRLLGRLHFSDIQTSGMHASANEPAAYPDEHREINDALQSLKASFVRRKAPTSRRLCRNATCQARGRNWPNTSTCHAIFSRDKWHKASESWILVVAPVMDRPYSPKARYRWSVSTSMSQR